MSLNILFVLHVVSQARHFTSLCEELIRRGHKITLLVEHKSAKSLVLPAYLKHIPDLGIEKLVYPTGFWANYSRAFRATRNYLLYYHLRFEKASLFADRAYGWTDPFLRRWLPKSTPPNPRFRQFLERAESAIPPDRRIRSFIRDREFDLILISPYIFYQNLFHNDYAKCAHALGIPVGFPVFSWDNLTSKGNVQILPDRIWVWNETQLRELTDLHGITADQVGVMGAWRFEDFRALRPSSDRLEFCRALGLDADMPTIAYLGSSPAIAPDEGGFVVRWLDGLRACDDPMVASANVIVRAHPRNVDAWKTADSIRSDARVVFQEPAATSFWDTQNLYDMLAHCHAAVGLNTSAMLEAAILRRPVHTVRDPSVRSGHEGTVHFQYLASAGGGLLYVAEDYAEHHHLLAESLRRPLTQPDPKADAFFRAFIDSGADDRSPTLRLADEIVSLAALRKDPTRRRGSDRVTNALLSAAIRTRLLPVKREIPVAAATANRITDVAHLIGPHLSKWLKRIDPTRTLESYLVTTACRRFGHNRSGPTSLEGMPFGVRALGRVAGSLIHFFSAGVALIGVRRRLGDILGTQLAQYDRTLPVSGPAPGLHTPRSNAQ